MKAVFLKHSPEIEMMKNKKEEINKIKQIRNKN